MALTSVIWVALAAVLAGNGFRKDTSYAIPELVKIGERNTVRWTMADIYMSVQCVLAAGERQPRLIEVAYCCCALNSILPSTAMYNNLGRCRGLSAGC